MERREILAAISQVSALRYELIAHIDLDSGADFASPASWEGHGVPLGLAVSLAAAVSKHDPVRYAASLTNADCRITAIGEPEYPAQLLDLFNPPLVLYMRGNGSIKGESLAVVGSRKATPYGRQVVEAVVPPLVASGIPTVSGLAHGIDTLVHVVTLRCGGTTHAVLGCGLDRIYPHANSQLAERIVKANGTLLSEYPPGTPPLRHHFPARNRIISGLSRGVVIVEGDLSSGSLITAEHAMEQGRDVFAVPGNIFSPQSRGPNHLIAQGATPLFTPASLLEYYGLDTTSQAEQPAEFSGEEQLILQALGHVPRDVDEIVQRAGLPVTIVGAKLVELEVAGAVERLAGGLYICLRNG